jgi:hypothetical protein
MSYSTPQFLLEGLECTVVPEGWRVAVHSRSPGIPQGTVLGWVLSADTCFLVQIEGSATEPFTFPTFDEALDFIAEFAFALSLGVTDEDL